MTTTTGEPAAANGRARKSLAGQIDRLDGILDGLANGLNEAVATVVQESVGIAVREAVQAVLEQVLANPEVLARLAGIRPGGQQATPAPAPAPRRWLGAVGQGLAKGGQAIGRGIQGGMRRVSGWCAALGRSVGRGVRAIWSGCQRLSPFRGHLLAALGIGVAAGVGAYFAGPWLAAVASGLGAFATTLTVQLGFWLRRALNGLAATWD